MRLTHPLAPQSEDSTSGKPNPMLVTWHCTQVQICESTSTGRETPVKGKGDLNPSRLVPESLILTALHLCLPRTVVRGDGQLGSTQDSWTCRKCIEGQRQFPGDGHSGMPRRALLENLNSGFLLPTRFVPSLIRALSSGHDNNKSNKQTLHIH